MNALAEDMTGMRGETRYQEPMSRHTTWRVGGPARVYYQPADLSDLQDFLQQLDPAETLVWVGLGSNLLVRDGGIDGVVIAPFAGLNELALQVDGSIRAEAGVACNKVARFAAKQGLVGGEFLAGIPGTMGGALAMNAGAWGGDTWSHVRAVETLDRQGRLHTRTPQEYDIAYRHVVGPADEWFVAAHLRFARGDVDAAQARIRTLLEQRSATQPSNMPSCGSVFRNPPGDHAARLIEACGLKGYCVGEACVSEKHANFIINTGAARATDIETLIARVQSLVEQHFNIRLQPEVRIIGEALST